MAWTSPKTFLASTALPAADLNTHLRDNMLETAPAKASAAGQLFVATGANVIAARTPSTATVATLESTTNTAYVDLATAGPAVTVTTGTQALVVMSAALYNNTVNGYAYVGYAVSGATTIAAAASRALQLRAAAVNQQLDAGVTFLETGLTAGSNTFTLKYSINTGATTASFSNRRIVVIPLS